MAQAFNEPKKLLDERRAVFAAAAASASITDAEARDRGRRLADAIQSGKVLVS